MDSSLFRLGPLTLPNRMVMPPMATKYATREGLVTQRLIDYYGARATGGVGLVVVEYSCVEKRGRARWEQLSIADDRCVPGLSDLAAAIKRRGVATLIQIHHAGREARAWDAGTVPVAPSPVRSLNPAIPMPRSLTIDEILEVAGRFVEAAERAKRAGFDGVELHGAHGYLVAQFLSPLSNLRQDDYGGPLTNRARILVDIVLAIKRQLGRGFPVGVRLNGSEFAAGGITIEEACAVAKMVEGAGADYISVSGGGDASTLPISIAPACYEPGFLLPLAAQVRRAVTVPVIGVGRINAPAVAEAALGRGQCDLVALGRALIADPEFPNKAAAGREAEIRPCVACMHCLDTGMRGEPLSCANNPTTGRERELALWPKATPKKVFVIGGGVAGMEAACTAAQRGHDVTLYERSDQLGGQIIAAAAPPHKDDLNLLRRYYLSRLVDAGVTVELSQPQVAATVAAAGPDAVIIATGSRPQSPDIAGIDGPNVVLAEEVLLGRATVGRRVAVLGGELVGCETAEYLAEQGKQVTILRRSNHGLASKTYAVVRSRLLDRLAGLSVVARLGVKCEEINSLGLAFVDDHGDRQLLEVDAVVIAAGSESSGELAAALRGQVPIVTTIGDAASPRGFMEAIHEGMSAGLEV